MHELQQNLLMLAKLTNVILVPIKTSFKQQEIPQIPPLVHENEFVTDFKEKAELFNFHFATQCSLVSNSSKLPSHI